MVRLSRNMGDLLIRAIEVHMQAAACSVEQAAELVERAKKVKEISTDDRGSSERRQFLATLGTWRATHELEAATHAAALTQIGCTLALLESVGVDVDDLLGAALNKTFLSRFDDEETPAG